MRIQSLRLERYPFCACRCLRKNKRKLRELRNRWFIRLKLNIVLFSFKSQWVYAVLIQQLLQTSLLSNFVSAHRLLRRSCSLRNQIQFASKAMPAHRNLMTCSYNIIIFTPNGLTPDQRAGHQHGAFSYYLSITSSLNLLISLFPWKSSQTMQVLIKGEGEVFDKRCLKCLSELLQKLTTF